MKNDVLDFKIYLLCYFRNVFNMNYAIKMDEIDLPIALKCVIIIEKNHVFQPRVATNKGAPRSLYAFSNQQNRAYDGPY